MQTSLEQWSCKSRVGECVWGGRSVLQLQNVLKHDKSLENYVSAPILAIFSYPFHLKVIYKITSFLFLKESGPSLKIFKDVPLVNE
jgi:hypothetical protein